MNRAEVATLLALAAARDRRTVGQADVAAWFEDLCDLQFADAKEALGEHFRESMDWLMPAHIRARARVIRDRRRNPAEIRELPSRFEPDEERAARVRAGIAMCVEALSLPTQRRRAAEAVPDEDLSPSDRLRQRAIERGPPLPLAGGEVYRERRLAEAYRRAIIAPTELHSRTVHVGPWREVTDDPA